MSSAQGWIIDEHSLHPVAVDPQAVRRALATATASDRLMLLRLADCGDQAYAEGTELISQLAADPACDPWAALLAHADTCWMVRADFAEARQLQARAWREARTRSRQATTLHRIGVSRFAGGDLDGAATFFALAQTMRRGFAGESELAESESAMRRVRPMLGYDAVILAGGSGRRLGSDKPAVRVAGWPMLDHVLTACAGAGRRIVVGPRRIALTDPLFCREDPPGGGPVAAIAAALEAVEQPLVAVFAADLPCIGAGIASLRDALDPDADAGTSADVAAFVEISGRTNYLASMWRTTSLRTAVAGLSRLHGTPVRELFGGVQVATVPDFDAVAVDCDTPGEVAEADQRLRRRMPDGLAATPLAWRGLELAAPS